MAKRFLSLAEVGEELGCSQSQAYALVRTGALTAMKLGGRGQWRVERTSLEEFIAQSYIATRQFVSAHPFGPPADVTDPVPVGQLAPPTGTPR